MVVGVYILLGKHTGNSKKHPFINDVVSEKSCSDRTKRIEELISSESKLAAERHKNLGREMGEAKTNTKRIFELLDSLAKK